MGSHAGRGLNDLFDTDETADFVGRRNELESFSRNLKLALDDPARKIIYNVYGQSGVGKTTLMDQYCRMAANEVDAVVAISAKTEPDIPALMDRFITQFGGLSKRTPRFVECYKTYSARRYDMEADPNAPLGLSTVISGLARGSVYLGKLTPAAPFLTVIDPEKVGKAADEITTYIARKVKSRDEEKLMRNPLDELSKAFVLDLADVASAGLVVMCFDNYDRAGEHVDQWLRELLHGEYGAMPLNFALIVAGKLALNSARWVRYAKRLAPIELRPFSAEEVAECLARGGITDPERVAEISQRTHRIPIWVAAASVQSENSGNEQDSTNSKVDYILQGLPSDVHRELVQRAALPRRVNRDILTVVAHDLKVEEAFDWLKSRDFVHKASEAWVFHEAMRLPLLSNLHEESPNLWRELHTQMTTYYEDQLNNLSLSKYRMIYDAEWQESNLELVYHKLCSQGHNFVAHALDGFIGAFYILPPYALRWAQVLLDAGDEARIPECIRWGSRLLEGVRGYLAGEYRSAVDMMSSLIVYKDLGAHGRARAHELRARLKVNLRQYIPALTDVQAVMELEPHNDELYILRADIFRSLDRDEEALQDVAHVIDKQPEHLGAWRRRGLCLDSQMRYEEAKAAFEVACELSSADDRAQASFIALIAEVSADEREYRKARELLDRALTLDSDLETALCARAEVLLALGCHEEALADLVRVLALDEGYVRAYVVRGEVFSAMGNHDAAMQDYTHALELDGHAEHSAYKRIGQLHTDRGEPQDAVVALKKSVAANPSCSEAWHLLGIALRQLHPSRDILPLLYKTEVPRETYKVVCYRAVALEQLGYKGDAMRDYARAVRLAPNYWYSYMALGTLHFRSGNYSLARKFLEAGYRLNSYDPSLVRYLGLTYEKLGDDSSLLDDLSSEIERTADNVRLWSARIKTYAVIKGYRQALELCNELLAARPAIAQYYLLRADIYSSLERFPEAVLDYEYAALLDPEKAHYNQLGVTLNYLGKFDEAIHWLRLGLDQEPNDEALLYNYAVAIACLDGPEAAAASFAAARGALGSDFDGILTGSDRATIVYGLGGLAALSGEVETSLQYLEQAIAASPRVLHWARNDPAWLSMRTHPVYQELVGLDASSAAS